MQAVLMGTQQSPEMKVIGDRLPMAMLPLMDKPFIQHIVEFLVKNNFTRLDIIVGHLPEKIEALLGNGERWGIEICYHLVKDPSFPYEHLAAITKQLKDEPVLLVHTDRMPHNDMFAQDYSAYLSSPKLFCWSEETQPISESQTQLGKWTGWGWVPAAFFEKLPQKIDEQALFEHLFSSSDQDRNIVKITPPLLMQSYQDLLDSNKAMLSPDIRNLMVSGREVEQGIWLSRNVSLHPSARLIPPVYVGENCRIDKGAKIGPNVVIGNECVIDKKTMVDDSVVFSGSYIGEGLEINQSIIDKNCLVNLNLGGEMVITEEFILGSMKDKRILSFLGNKVFQFIGVLFLLLFSPLLLGTAIVLKFFREGPLIYKKEVVQLPSIHGSELQPSFFLYSFVPNGVKPEMVSKTDNNLILPNIKDFLLRFLPALANVIRGELCFVGVSPRSREEIEALPSDWRSLYLNSKPGIVTEAAVNFGMQSPQDDIYISEAYYSVCSGLIYDFKLLLKFMVLLLGVLPSDKH